MQSSIEPISHSPMPPAVNCDFQHTKEGGTRLNFRIYKPFVQLASPLHSSYTHTHTYTHTRAHTRTHAPKNAHTLIQVIHSFTMNRKTKFHLPARSIPERSSSRYPEKGDSSSLKRIRDLENENKEAKEETKAQVELQYHLPDSSLRYRGEADTSHAPHQADINCEREGQYEGQYEGFS